MLRRYLLALLAVFSLLVSSASFALPFSIVTKPGTQLPTQVQLGSTTSAYYTVTNNNNSERINNYVKHLPPNVLQITSGGTYPDTCGKLFSLAPRGQANDSCTLQLLISGPVNENASPDMHIFVCFPGGKTCAGTPTPLNVVQAFPVSIAVAPVTSSIDFQNTQQYTAIGTFSDGLTINITPLVNWITSNSTVATISGSGLATGGYGAGGTTTITANVNGVTSNLATLTVAAVLTITATPSTNTEVGAVYSQTNVANGGFTPYTYRVSGGAIPNGTTLNTATGTVSGTPTVAGTFSYTITVTDLDGKTVSVSTSVTIAAPVAIAATASTVKQVGLNYSQTNVASNGILPYVYTVSVGAVPLGTALNSATGTVSGTPATSGAFGYTIKVTDGNGRTASVATSGSMTAMLGITATPPANTIVGGPYSQLNTASGGTAPYTYSISSGTVPDGTALNLTTGTVSGTPTTAAPYSYTVQVADANGAIASVATSVTIAATLALVATPSTATEVGAAYSQVNTASGGVDPLTYAVTGTVPTGTSLNNATGIVSGTPTTAAPFSYTVTVTDHDGNSATASSSGSIASAPALTATPTTNPIVGVAYSQLNTVTGGTGPFTYSVASGTLPPGTGLNMSTGTVSGTPTTAGPYTYVIKVTDSNGLSATASSTVTIASTLALTATPSANTMVGAAYSQANAGSGGIMPLTYTVATGPLPAGTTLNNATGLVSGTPNTVAPYSYVIQVTDSKGNTATAATSVNIAPTLTLTATASTNTEVNTGYSQTNVGTGGISPLTYTVSSGPLPAGTNLNSATGTVSGTPTASGSFSYVIKVTDADGNTATATSSGSIAALLGLTATASANMEVGAAYSQANTRSGGTAPYTYGLSAGALPNGTNLNTSTGLVSGTPTTAGIYNYTIQVTDNAGATAAAQSSGTIAGAIGLTATPAPDTMVGATYTQINTVTGGAMPYTYSVSTGTIPAGTNLNSATGTVSGTPTTAAGFSYTILVSDAFGNTASAPSSGTIAATIALTATPSTFTEVGANYSQLNTVSGGTTPFTYGLSAGALPDGTNLSSTGTVSGTPTTTGVFSYTIQVTDSQGNTSTATSTGTMTATVTIAATASTNQVVGRAYSQSNVASGGTLPYVYSIAVGGTVPTGTTLNPATGLVSGTPTTAGTFNYTVVITDNDGATASAPTTATIAAVLGLTATPSTDQGVGVPYSQANTVSGGKGPYTYNLSAGAVPDGTLLNTSTGTVSGTPTTSGVYNYTVQVSDSESFTATAQSTGTIAATLTLAATPSADTEVNRPYSQVNTPTGGVAPYSYTVASGSIPNGTLLNSSTGTVSGTPITSGTFSYVIKVSDSDGASATAPSSGTIFTAVAITPTASTHTEVGATYSQTNVASGGVVPYAYTVASGAVPAGTTLSPTTGTVSGSPTTVGGFSYSVKVTDNNGATATTALTTGNITAGVTLAATNSTNTEVGAAYSQTNVASGGTPPYTFSVSVGAIPAGTTLNASGTVSGTPTTAAPISYTIQATDSIGSSATAATTGNIAATVGLTATPSAATQVGQPYSQLNTVSGGVAPYTYSVSVGPLPANTNLNSGTGTVSGTPTTSGGFTYTILVTDSDGMTATAATSGNIAVAWMLKAATSSDADIISNKSSAISNNSFVDYTFNGTTGDTVNHVRLCLATDATCDTCSNPQDIATSIDMGKHYHISNKMLTDYLMRYTSVLNPPVKPNSTYYIGLYVSSTGSNCSTPEGANAYCGTSNTGHKNQTHMCITATSANGATITNLSKNGDEVYLTKSAQYVYANDSSANNVLQCVPNANGSFSNCASIASIISPYATAFADVHGAQFAYITAGDGNVYQCQLSNDGANTFSCNVLSHGGITPSSPQAIAFLNMGSNQYAYLGNASGNVYQCPVSNDGTFGDCSATTMTNGSNAIAFQALHDKQYIYGVNSNGNIEKCAVSVPDGILSNCNIQTGPAGVSTSLVFESIKGSAIAYVTSNTSGRNLVYYSKLDASGNFSTWKSTNNPSGASTLVGIAISKINNNLYANVSTQDGTVYQCTINQVSGDLSSCSLSSKTSATLSSSVTMGYALAHS